MTPKKQYLLIAALVAWAVALAIASGFGLRAVIVTGWLILAGVLAVVACVRLTRRRRG